MGGAGSRGSHTASELAHFFVRASKVSERMEERTRPFLAP